VGVDGRLSPLAPVVSVVPQGTVLGPCLFLVHLMDISVNLSAGTIASYLQLGIESEQNCETLQQGLETMYSWAEMVGMEFNAGKFELLRFWPVRNDAPDILYMAQDGSPIEEQGCLRDLGVRVSTDLTFSEQIDSAVQSGNCMAGWTLRTFRGRGRQLMFTVLRTLIHTRLDYCSQLWSPRDQYSINLLESFQKHFIFQMKDPALKGMSYRERLSELRV
jgi:ribonuclease P/MRP protein subunit RPP40